jgi:hypothetical protein
MAAKYTKLKKLFEQQVPVYVRCLRTERWHGTCTTSKAAEGVEVSAHSGHSSLSNNQQGLHWPGEEPIVLCSTEDKRPFVYLKCDVEDFSYKKEISMTGQSGDVEQAIHYVEISFPRVERYWHCGFVGTASEGSSVGGYGAMEEDPVGAISSGPEHSGENTDGGAMESISTSSKAVVSANVSEIALHKIVLEEDLMTSVSVAKRGGGGAGVGPDGSATQHGFLLLVLRCDARF